MTDQPPIDRSDFLDKIGFAFAEDGKVVQLRFFRKNDKVAYVSCEYADLSTVVLRIEQAAGRAWELQREALGGADPRLSNRLTVRTVERLQGA